MTFRRLAAAAALTLVSAAPAAAQGFGYGGKAGINLILVTFEQDDSVGITAKPGVVAGGFVTLGLGNRLSAEVDAYYSQRKFRFDEGDIVDTLSYFELPILARVQVVSKESWSVAAVGGAALAFLQSASETVSGHTYDINGIESFDASAVAGAQVQFFRRFIVDVRYLWGLSDVYVTNDFSGKTRGLQITGGYRIR